MNIGTKILHHTTHLVGFIKFFVQNDGLTYGILIGKVLLEDLSEFCEAVGTDLFQMVFGEQEEDGPATLQRLYST